jgi:[protein-PII] uridylyltransferase
MPTDVAKQVAAARQRAAAGVKEGKDGITLSRALSDELDNVVCGLAGPLLEKCGAKVAILATGGFGRRELAPFSDLDLLCLCADEPGPAVIELARALLPPLWDAKVDAGHAVRSYEQALALPAKDLAAATALLDARFLIGDAELSDKFLAEYRASVAETAAENFVARLREEQQKRHSRFGDTIFLLEPDLKNGPGGVRDLCMGRWAAQARFGTSEPSRLRDLGS